MSPESQFKLRHKLHEETSATAEAQPTFLHRFTSSSLARVLYESFEESNEDD